MASTHSIISVLVLLAATSAGAQQQPAQAQPQVVPVVQPAVQAQQSPATIKPIQVQPQAQQQQPLQLVIGQPPSQITPAGPAVAVQPTTKPVVTKLEVVKPKFEMKTPVKVAAVVKTNHTTAAPKNRMKIVKSADLVKPKSSPSADDSKGMFSSLVDVDRAENKSRVGVHIPLIFDMTNDKDISSGKQKLDLTVLSGLVSVNKDRENGKGPLTVAVLGIPIYSGTGLAGGGARELFSRISSTLTDQRRKFDDQIERVAGSRQLSDSTMDMYSSVKRTGERGIAALTDSLDKVSSFLKEQAVPIANTNGRPATRDDRFVTKPPQFRPQDLKPSLSESAFKKFAAGNATSHELHLQNTI